MGFSADEACDVGRDTGSPASPDYGPTDNAFTGTIDWVQIDVGDDGHDHLITPEDRFNIAMASGSRTGVDAVQIKVMSVFFFHAQESAMESLRPPHKTPKRARRPGRPRTTNWGAGIRRSYGERTAATNRLLHRRLPRPECVGPELKPSDQTDRRHPLLMFSNADCLVLLSRRARDAVLRALRRRRSAVLRASGADHGWRRSSGRWTTAPATGCTSRRPARGGRSVRRSRNEASPC